MPFFHQVSVFLSAENAPYGDIDNLEIQVKDSDALVEDVDNLKSKMEELNKGGRWLISCTAGEKKKGVDDEMHTRLNGQLQSVNDTWDHIASKSKSQNASLRAALERSVKLQESLDEIATFVTQLQKVPFIYYVSTFIAQNLFFHINWVFLRRASCKARLLVITFVV